ncbi:MAG: hypothetical protein COA86_16260 [Kangiella sp.]|nr:MAG: hypothetical protein COA86_16260 [Kangiella sp.]
MLNDNYKYIFLFVFITLVACSGSIKNIKQRNNLFKPYATKLLIVSDSRFKIEKKLLKLYSLNLIEEKKFYGSKIQASFKEILLPLGATLNFIPNEFSIYRSDEQYFYNPNCNNSKKCGILKLKRYSSSWRSPYHTYKNEPLELSAVFYLILNEIGDNKTSIEIVSVQKRAILGKKCCGAHSTFFLDIQEFPDANTRNEEQRILMYIEDLLATPN